jgi:DNA-binding transcriptional MocR family regulator
MAPEMILVKLDHRSPEPVYAQIVQGIRRMVESDLLAVGTKLPATREMAAHLGVNRSTVFRAYQELFALGYLESRPGSYTTVRDKPKTTVCEPRRERGLLSWEQLSNPQSRTVIDIFRRHLPELDTEKHPDVLNLSPLEVDPRLFPVEEVRRCMNRVLVDEGSKALEYGEHAGYRPLRDYLAHRMQIHGISVSADEVLITNGSHQGLDLILRLLTRPGSKVVVESPTYGNFLPLLKYFQVEIVEIPLRDGGMDLKQLGKVLQKGKPALVYTIPNFQNPTGLTSPQAHREMLLRLCEKHRVPLVEDGFEEEMKYCGNVALPIKSMDKHNVVIYIGTFSKVLFPGMRIGWIAAQKECIERLTALKRFSDLSSSVLTQAVANTFCRDGHYDRHLRRMHRLYRKRMRVALSAMKQHMPDSIAWTKPEGGYTIWGSLEKSYINEREFKETLLKHRVMVAPGHYFFSQTHPRRHFRLSIATLNEEEIREGIKRLGKALRELERTGEAPA